MLQFFYGARAASQAGEQCNVFSAVALNLCPMTCATSLARISSHFVRDFNDRRNPCTGYQCQLQRGQLNGVCGTWLEHQLHHRKQIHCGGAGKTTEHSEKAGTAHQLWRRLLQARQTRARHSRGCLSALRRQVCSPLLCPPEVHRWRCSKTPSACP